MKKYIPHLGFGFIVIVSLTLVLMAVASRGASILTADLAPALLVKLLPGDTTSVPLGINDADIDIKVTGNIAVTTMTLNFYNDQNRNLEGQFIFPLAEGQTIHYFAMDVAGVMHESAVVEKQKGREVFESIERRRVDPGLLEWSRGNNFSARIFPIPSKGYKKIVVAFQQELKENGNTFIYNLPLGFKARVKHFGIKATVSGEAAQPIPMDDNAYMLSFNRPATEWKTEVEYKNIIPDHAIQFQIPVSAQVPPVYVEKVEGTADSYYFYALVHADVKNSTKSTPQKLGIIWDISGSAAGRDREREMDIIKQYLATLKDVNVRVTTFSNVVHEQKNFAIAGGNAGELLDYLKGCEPDGGTQLGCLDLSASDRDEILLFSDGIHDFGDRAIKFPRCPVYTFSTGSGADYSTLRYIGTSTNGRFIDAAALKTEDVLPLLMQSGFNYLSATTQGIVSEVYPSVPVPCAGYFGISGIVKGKSGSVTVNFGTGNTVSQSISFDLSHVQLTDKTIGRIWAQKRIAELELQADRNEAEITKLGRQFSIITRYTSLIVLESLDDYVRYSITPPGEKMKKEYAEQMKTRQQQIVKETGVHRDKVAEDFKRVVTWWDTDYKTVYPKHRVDSDRVIIDSLGHRRVVRGGSWRDLGYYTDSVAVTTTEGTVSHDMVQSYSIDPVTLEEQERVYDEVTTISSSNLRNVGVSGASGSGSGNGQHSGTADRANRSYSLNVVSNGYFATSATASGATNSYMWATGQTRGADMAARQEADGKGTMSLKAWDSKEPYMTELKSAQTDGLYKKYLSLKSKYKDMPSFYIDAADYLERSKKHAEAVRVLSNLAEIKSDDSRLMRVMAHRLEQWSENALAVKTFEEVLMMKPEEPQSYRDLGLAYAADKQYQRAADVLCKVMNRNWDGRFPEIEALTACEINYLAATCGQPLRLDSLDKRLIKDMPVDIRVLIDWDADNCDIDLWVTDPAGEKCMYSYPMTRAGGRISKDFTQGYGPEEFKLRKALPGKYKVEVHYYNNAQLTLAGPTTIHAQMYTNYGRATEQRKEIMLRLALQKDQEYVGDFEFSR